MRRYRGRGGTPASFSLAAAFPAQDVAAEGPRRLHDASLVGGTTDWFGEVKRMGTKLILAIVQGEDAGTLIDALMQEGHRATRINASGGFLKSGNAMILMGVPEAAVDGVLSVIKANCRTRKKTLNLVPPIVEVTQMCAAEAEVVVGGATVFVLGVPRYERL